MSAAVYADLSIDGVNQDILGLQSFSHRLTNALEGGQALLNVVKMEILLPLGHLPILQASTDYMHQVYSQRRKASMPLACRAFRLLDQSRATKDDTALNLQLYVSRCILAPAAQCSQLHGSNVL